MQKNVLLVGALVVVVLALVAVLLFSSRNATDNAIPIVKHIKPKSSITNFEQCVKAGNPVMESYPRQCRAEKKTFVESVEPNEPIEEFVPEISESVAKSIAEKSCIKGGEALGVGTYNGVTKTWWFNANLNSKKQGCNPACVVSEETKTAEINWRCTGLLPQRSDDLVSQKWLWQRAVTSAGKTIVPQKANVFSLDFKSDGNVSIITDCNGMSASFSATGQTIALSEIASTMMYCEGSQESEFSALLGNVTSYKITGEKGSTLELASEKGTLFFTGTEK